MYLLLGLTFRTDSTSREPLPNPASSFAAGVKISAPVRVVAVPPEFAEIEIDAGLLAAVGRIGGHLR